MFIHFLNILEGLDDLLWSYLAIPMIIGIGIFLSFQFRFMQIFRFRSVMKTFFDSARHKDSGHGAHPLKVFFASIGGCIGIGNIVAVCTAIQIGGPGAIFWMWVAALIGMIVKYAEIYLGIVYRTPNNRGGYDGGPMYYLKKVFNSNFLPIVFAFLLAIYGTEVYMFDVMAHSITQNWHLNHYLVIALILGLIIYTSQGGINRIGQVSSIIIPLFLVVFCSMSAWILFKHLYELPAMFGIIMKSAFTGHASIGGFAGSGIMLAMSQGVARGCYSGDIGVGYASIVQAESQHSDPAKQAQLSILGIFIDTFVVCTCATLLILVTGVWHQDISASMMVQKALEQYFPYMHIFMPIFLFILGYSSLIAFFYVGLKCARYIHPTIGTKVYYAYAIIAFIVFSFLDQSLAMTMMSIVGAILLSINLLAIHKLRKEIKSF